MTAIALLLLAALIGMTLFQLLLILGKPLGEYAWGGQHKVLPKNLRIGSCVSIVIYGLISAIYAEKSELMDTPLSSDFADVAMWVVTAYLALGILLNGISRSKKERYLWTPIVTMLAGLSLMLALS